MINITLYTNNILIKWGIKFLNKKTKKEKKHKKYIKLYTNNILIKWFINYTSVNIFKITIYNCILYFLMIIINIDKLR